MKRLIALFLALTLLMTTVPAMAAKHADTLTVEKTKISLSVGDTMKLQPAAVCTTGKHSDEAVLYASSNSDIVKVSKTGKLTAVAAGKATITATWRGEEVSVKVKVRATEEQPANTHSDPALDAAEKHLKKLQEHCAFICYSSGMGEDW